MSRPARPDSIRVGSGARRHFLIATADQSEYSSGALDRLIASVDEPDVIFVLVLRAVQQADVVRLVLDGHVVLEIGRCGASGARNVGLAWIRHRSDIAPGDVVAFPDADCEYEPGLLGYVGHTLDASDASFVSIPYGPSRDEVDRNRFPVQSRSGLVAADFVAMSSVTLFVTWRLLERVGYFNSGLGPGPGQVLTAAEDSDLALRLLARTPNGVYTPTPVVKHPYKPRDPGAWLESRIAVTTAHVGRGGLSPTMALRPIALAISLALRRAISPRRTLEILRLGLSPRRLVAIRRYSRFSPPQQELAGVRQVERTRLVDGGQRA